MYFPVFLERDFPVVLSRPVQRTAEDRDGGHGSSDLSGVRRGGGLNPKIKPPKAALWIPSEAAKKPSNEASKKASEYLRK